MDVSTRIDMDAVERSMRAARMRVPNAMRDALRTSAETHALPRVRRGAPSFAQPLLVARASSRAAYITTRGSKSLDRALGLLNYGGTVRTRIVPKRVARAEKRAAEGLAPAKRTSGAKALMTPRGPRAAVNNPRTYRAQHFLERDVAASVPDVAREFRDRSLSIFEGLHTERSG